MNYVPFTFVEAIHEEKNAQMRSYQRRHNYGVMPQSALPPDPIGLLYSQIHNAIDRIVDRIMRALFHAESTGNEARTSNLSIDQRRQPHANAVAQ